MNKYNQIWMSKGKTKIKTKTKLKIYKTSTATNCSGPPWAFKQHR